MCAHVTQWWKIKRIIFQIMYFRRRQSQKESWRKPGGTGWLLTAAVAALKSPGMLAKCHSSVLYRCYLALWCGTIYSPDYDSFIQMARCNKPHIKQAWNSLTHCFVFSLPLFNVQVTQTLLLLLLNQLVILQTWKLSWNPFQNLFLLLVSAKPSHNDSHIPQQQTGIKVQSFNFSVDRF